jgi:hypothetical protein
VPSDYDLGGHPDAGELASRTSSRADFLAPSAFIS